MFTFHEFQWRESKIRVSLIDRCVMHSVSRVCTIMVHKYAPFYCVWCVPYETTPFQAPVLVMLSVSYYTVKITRQIFMGNVLLPSCYLRPLSPNLNQRIRALRSGMQRNHTRGGESCVSIYILLDYHCSSNWIMNHYIGLSRRIFNQLQQHRSWHLGGLLSYLKHFW